jgi:hypothetical protein
LKKLLNLIFVLVFSLGILSNTASAASLEKFLGTHGPDEYAIIYGSFDTSAINTTINTIALLRYPTKTKFQMGIRTDVEDYHNHKKGYFWAIAKPGQYYLSQILTDNGKNYLMNIDNQYIQSHLMTVDKGGLFYSGSSKFIKLSEKQFAFRTVASPGEKEILEDLLLHAKGTKWEEVIINRLKSL